MSVRALAKEQPASFEFNEEFNKLAQERIAMYPEGKQASAIVPLLWFAQKQHDNWIPEAALRHIGDLLGMAYMRVLEVVTFYTMFNLAPVGKHFVQFCGTTPCWLNGADAIKKACKDVIGEENTITADGEFSWLEVECLGACVNAPMVQINDDFYEDLNEDNFKQLLADLKAGNPTKIGTQAARQNAAPVGGATSLTDESLFDGSMVGGYKAIMGELEKVEQPAKDPVPKAKSTPKPKPVSNDDAEVSDDLKPETLKSARGGKADILTDIKGVGPKIEGILHSLGIFHFDQIAKWTADEKAWVDSKLKFKGRIDRENWIDQAKTLAKQGDK